MTDATATSTYTYDSSDRLTQVIKPNGTLSYSYDLASNLTSTMTSGGINVSYGYDALNRPASVSDSATGASNYTYDAVGNLTSMAYPNAISQVLTYNHKNQLTTFAAAKGNSSIASYAYTLDGTGRRLSVAELGGRVAAYTYDSTYKLLSETVSGATSGPNGSVSYTYDNVGNRLQATSTLAGIPSGVSTYDSDDRLAADNYDADGNTTSSDGIGNGYDFENHLTQHGGVTIVYDGDGNRVSKTVGGVTTEYLVDDRNLTGFPQVIEETATDGSVRRFVYGLQWISQKQVLAGPANTVTSFYVYDGHGSVRTLTDAAGAVTDTYDYDAFGNLLHKTGSTPNEFLFAGEQFDADLGMYYNRARYLKPATGRFVSMDTVEGDPQSPLTLHKYLYGNADGVNAVDPSGHDDLSSTMMSIAINTTLSVGFSVAFSHLTGHDAAAFVALHLLPPGFLDTIAWDSPDALLVGFGVSGSVGSPEDPFGVTGGGGYDVVIGKRGFAVYYYLAAGLSLGATSNGGSVSGYGGVLWRTKDSGAYQAWFKNVSLPLSVVGQRIATFRNAFLKTVQFAGNFNLALYKPEVDYALNIAAESFTKSTSATLNLFFDPTSDTGSMGFSVAFGASTSGASTNISFAFSYFWQIYGSSGDPTPFR